MEKQKHLITGGTGFIGRHVAQLLASRGHTVTLASRTLPNFKFAPDIAQHISWVQLNIANADWDKLLYDVDVVHHYAWTSLPASANTDPAADLAANVTATIRLLDAVKRRRCRLVFASSGGTVYGITNIEMPIPERTLFAPITAYGASKAAAEIYLNLYRSLHWTDCRIARIANPYGAGQNTGRGQGAVSAFLGKALRNEPIIIWGNGAIIRDYIHISDTADGLVKLALAHPGDLGGYCTYNIGSGVGHSLNDLISEIERLLGRRLNVEYAEARTFDVPVNILSIERAREILGWRPFLDFSDGLALTLDDIKAGRKVTA